MSTTHAMPDSNDRTGNLIALQVDETEKISGMIEPASCGIVSMAAIISDRNNIRSFPRRSSLITLLWP